MTAFTLPIDRPTSLLKILATALVFGLAACSEPESPTSTADPRSPVRAAEVTTGEAGREVRLPGVVRARQRARPAFLHPGTLAARLVKRGEAVTVGQRLAVLHNPSLAPAVAAAEARVGELDARLARLRRDLDRLQPLRDQGVASEDELDAVTSELAATRQTREQAAAQLDGAREQLAEANLRAPFAGRVGDLLVEPGDFVAAGQPVLSLVGDADLEVEIALSARLEANMITGTPVSITRPLQGGRFSGTLTEIGRVAGPVTMAAAVVSIETDSGLAPGQAVHIHLPLGGTSRLQVPLAALLDPGGRQPRLMRIDAAGRVEMVPVSTGRLIGDRVNISGDLDVGDQVVIAGHGHLTEGESVRVLP